MTLESLRTPTLAAIFVAAGVIGHHVWTAPTPLPLQAAPIADGELCHRCQRVIADRAIAAEGIAADGSVRKFKTIACMTKYLRDSGETLDILVADFPSRRFTQARWATFVRTTITPQGDVDYVAFRQPADARWYASGTQASRLDWTTVQESERRNPLIR
jgi:hypothetical protein